MREYKSLIDTGFGTRDVADVLAIRFVVVVEVGEGLDVLVVIWAAVAVALGVVAALLAALGFQCQVAPVVAVTLRLAPVSG